MPGQRRFRILTPDGLLSHDTFVLPATQPRNIVAGCVRVVHEQSGTMLTVHDSRLFPAGATESAPLVPKGDECLPEMWPMSRGVAQDEVSCPKGSDGTCGMVHAPQETTMDVPFSSSP